MNAKNRAAFTAVAEPYRRELLAHCYRMVGSAQEAEDLLQDSLLRAWRAYDSFEDRASVRSWLYKIATNVCLTARDTRRKRVLPSGLGGPSPTGDTPPRPIAPGEVSWLEPFPDRWCEAPDGGDDPAQRLVARQSMRLALIASLQYLPPRQRAIVLLREVLDFSADETAAVLDTTTAAVKSGLQRARARLEEVAPAAEQLLEPGDPRARQLLEGYIAAFERSDPKLLVDVLRADATLEATPFRDWQAGNANCVRMLAAFVLGKPGDWRMLATSANDQPAAAAYRRDTHGLWQAQDVVVLATTVTGIASVVAFHDPSLVAMFGLPSTLTR